MSWLNQLYITYERNIGKESAKETGMTPVAHMNANAQIEVTLNQKGEFLTARKVEKDEAETLIPVSEASAGRSSGIAPHALCDTLSYIAGDYEIYCKNEKDKNGAIEKFGQYIEGLQKWYESEYTHPKIKAIFSYLSEKTLIDDLVHAEIVELDDNSFLADKKIAGQPYEKSFVRFRVLSSNSDADGTWEDDSLIEAYVLYYLHNQQGNEDICYFKGDKRTISENHPKGIISANYGAKLVSANDNQGYTYRGRFQNAEQAYSFSYEASQKIHSALTWLVKTQGVYTGTKDKRTFVCWNPDGKRTPDIFAEFGVTSDETDCQIISYKRKLSKTFQGYKDQFTKEDAVIVMSLDAATTGRLSVTYYNELSAGDFFDRINYWGETCCWLYRAYNEKQELYYRIETPIFQRIVKCAFGRERDGENAKYIEVDDKVLKEQVQRLLKCMLERQPVPFDIVQALAIRASTPLAYTDNNREKVLSTACAVIAKYYCDKNGREHDYMKLDYENHDRSYLFGRLLAVCEKIERATYERGETREANAVRLQSAYSNHPMQTWKILQELLLPYLQKLAPGLREYYKNLIGDIVAMFDEKDEPKLNQSLKETYLLGYYLQRAELNKKKETQKEEEENE